jgi:arylsulfatase A-like enzyme
MKCFLTLTVCLLTTVLGQAQSRPNIVLIMADDMGFSDIGCYGGEIPTPNIDALAKNGLRFTQFYNSARCCPTRASLLTGLHPHQTGVGHMTEEPLRPDAENWGTPGYQGFLNNRCATMAEMLKPVFYHTYMAGKWHLGMHGQSKWPLQRGFEKYYGMLAGAASYFKPQGARGLTYNNTPLDAPQGEYYTTDAFTDSAIAFTETQQDGRPFFLYLAYNAPHWPLQAKKEDIQKFENRYEKGWDAIREARLAKQKTIGLLNADAKLSERDSSVKAWTELTAQEKKDLAYRMAVYAAQISSMDQNIGKLIASLKKQGKFENTLIIFLSDNGACPEPYKLLGGGELADINDPSHSDAISYGTGWANASNTPFRKWKREMEEGGIRTPLIMHWPAGIPSAQRNKFINTPSYLIDVMPTVLEAAQSVYLPPLNGNNRFPLEGRSLAAVFSGKAISQAEYMFWEHEGNRAVRKGNWKAVKDSLSSNWMLFDLAADMLEGTDLAIKNPAVLKELTGKWQQWAETHAVFPKKGPYRDPNTPGIIR